MNQERCCFFFIGMFQYEQLNEANGTATFKEHFIILNYFLIRPISSLFRTVMSGCPGLYFLFIILDTWVSNLCRFTWQSLEWGVGSKSLLEFTTHFFLRTGSLGNLKSCLPVLVELEQFGAEQPPIAHLSVNYAATWNSTQVNVSCGWEWIQPKPSMTI